MRKLALVLVLAVLVPSLVLAWLAVRSLRDQRFLLERQQSLLYQGVADARARAVQDALAESERSFKTRVLNLLAKRDPQAVAASFDDLLRKDWPLAQVGFVVSLNGDILCPSPLSSPEARKFCADQSRFLANRETVEVYTNPKETMGNAALANAATQAASPDQQNVSNRRYPPSKIQARSVVPQQQVQNAQNFNQPPEAQVSKVAAAEAEFRQLIGDDTEGTLARFVDNRLNVLFWCRPSGDTSLVFGAQLALPRLIEGLRPLVRQLEPALAEEICLALLDDTARPVALSRDGFRAAWKRPFAATEIGEALPHWEVAVYLLDPAKLTRSAQTLEWSLGLLIAFLVLAIAAGSWRIVADLNRQLTLARQKTDFVSNVSHELKTPLTSIRM